jgi:hypothetical protein
MGLTSSVESTDVWDCSWNAATLQEPAGGTGTEHGREEGYVRGVIS